MKFASTAAVLASAGLAAAVPVEQEAKRAAAPNDYQILNYALTLEHLEATFYKEALAKFGPAAFKKAGHPAMWFRRNLQETAADEAEHVTFLTTAITQAGGHPVNACEYDFGLTDVKSFLQTSAILEGVGVTAYLGAASLISDPAYLTAAGSILTVEARHSAIVRAHIHEAPFAAPFDVPQDYNEVYSLASQFITGCPNQNPQAEQLTFTAFPVLTAAASGPASPGDSVTLTSAKALTGTVYYTWVTGAAAVYGTAASSNGGKTFTVKVPASGVNGQSYVLLTSSQGTFSDDNVLAGPAIVEVTSAYQKLP